METTYKTSGIRTCIACDIKKGPSDFARYQIACKECQENGVEYYVVCKECGQEKCNTEMIYAQTCRDCQNGKKRVEKKICTQCKSATNTVRRNQQICVECEAKGTVIYDKKCKDCNKLKPSSEFRHNRKTCLACEQAYGRDYRKTTTKAAEWTANNRERTQELQHEHYEKNKPQIRAKERERMQNDPFFRQVKLYRSGLCSLVSGKTQTNKKLAMGRIYYVQWLEFCFDNTMTMDNHVEIWQIDHVLALNAIQTKKIGKLEFGEDTDLSCLFEWYNTMPVLCMDNMKKNKYLNEVQLIQHSQNVKKFLKLHPDIKLSEKYFEYKQIVRAIVDKHALETQ